MAVYTHIKDHHSHIRIRGYEHMMTTYRQPERTVLSANPFADFANNHATRLFHNFRQFADYIPSQPG